MFTEIYKTGSNSDAGLKGAIGDRVFVEYEPPKGSKFTKVVGELTAVTPKEIWVAIAIPPKDEIMIATAITLPEEKLPKTMPCAVPLGSIKRVLVDRIVARAAVAS